MNAYNIIDHEYDVVVLGAGGSGLTGDGTCMIRSKVQIG